MKIGRSQRAKNQGRNGDLEHEIAEHIAGFRLEQLRFDGCPANENEKEDRRDIDGDSIHCGGTFAGLQKLSV